ncbi:MAG: DotU family type IV/VI secretion system protein [Holosporales bacterium]
MVHKKNIQEGTWLLEHTAMETEKVPGDDDVRIAAGAQAIHNDLRALLETQEIQATRMGGVFATSLFAETKFIAAALADEIFLNLDWQGRKYWEDHLLESALFGSHDAGDLFFSRLDHLLSEGDPAQRDLAEIYLLALGLDFQGRYRNRDDGGAVHRYMQHLYRFIYQRDFVPDLLNERLMPSAYQHTLSGTTPKFMQDVRRWLMMFAVTGVGLLAISYGVWFNLTAQVQNTTNRILTFAHEH